MAEPSRRRIGRRVAIGIAVVVAVPLLLVAIALAVLDSGAVTRRVMDAVLPRASAALGREVTVRGAQLALFPNPRVRLDGLVVAGRPGEPALVDGAGISAEVALWPLLVSLGKNVEVRAVELERPVVNLVRARDGTWNYEGLGGGGAGGSKPAPDQGASATRVVVQRFAIHGGTIRLLDRSAGSDDAGLAADGIDLDATGIGPGQPLTVRLGAALASGQRNLTADLSVSALPAGVPQRPQDWPAVAGELSLGPLAVDRVAPLLPAGASEIIRGGTVALAAKVATDAGVYRVEGTGDLRDLRLRGQAASGKFRAVATAPAGRLEAARLELRELAVKGPGVDLSGNAVVEASPLRARFALGGPLLDLDALMGALPQSEKAAAPKEQAAGGPLLPGPMRQQVRAATVAGSLDLGELRSGKLRATNVRARAVLRNGVLLLEDMDAGLYGGKLVASGTKVDLGQPEPSWTLAAKLDGVDLGAAMTSVLGNAPLTGKTSGSLHLSGNGIEWAKLRNQLTGAAALAIRDGALTTTDLGNQLLGGVSQALRAVGKGGAAEKVGGAGGKTTFKDLAANFAVKDGWMVTEKPFRFDTPVGPVDLGGRVGLDLRVDLSGSAAVPRDVLARIAPPALQGRLPASLAVPLGLGGTLSSPSVQVRADEAVSALVRGQAEQAAKQIRQEAEKKGKSALEDVFKRFSR